MDLGVAVGQEPYAGDDQEATKNVDYPVEALEQCRAGHDEGSPHHEGPENPPEQHPVLIGRGDGKEREDDEEHEDVVDRQRLLDEVAGKELQAALCAEPPVDE
jgi:hypothetical protein